MTFATAVFAFIFLFHSLSRERINIIPSFCISVVGAISIPYVGITYYFFSDNDTILPYAPIFGCIYMAIVSVDHYLLGYLTFITYVIIMALTTIVVSYMFGAYMASQN